ncbi:MAG TPA: hypothetical protein VGR53_10785 [Nitrososphaerales archaeon]|nr:hypothetical protein [Nitrososphaerales archaeon]
MSRKRMPMDAKDRALWEDAEGSLFVPRGVGKGNRMPVLLTSQLDKDIQLDYCSGARKDGVKCYVVKANVRKTKKTPGAFTFYITQVRDQVSLAKELRLTAPYRRNKKIRARIRKLKAWLKLPRTYLRKPIMEARNEMALF